MSEAVLLPGTARALELAARLVQSETRQPSLVAGVVRDGRLAWSTAVGESTGGRASPGPDLAYRIGSLTKTVTAVLVLQARDEGLLDLGDRLGKVLGSDAPFAGARLYDLLAHAAGLPAEPAGDWWERASGGDFRDLAGRVATQQPVLPPEQRHHYSNLAYGLLGRAVEQVRGGAWAKLVRERVLEPLGMTATTYAPSDPGERSARGYSVHPFSGRLLDEPSTDTGAMAPAGQLWSTVRDLARWSVFLLDGDDRVLSATSLSQMRTAARGSVDGLETVYGLGLSLHARPGGDRYGHGGSMPGFLAGLRVDPRQRAAAIALSNGTYGGTPVLPDTLLDVLGEHEPLLPEPWRPEPVVAGADEIAGEWYWGVVPALVRVQSGMVVLDMGRTGRSSRLVPAGEDRWRGLDTYFAGETLSVERDASGRVTSLRIATYALTRRPYEPATEPG
ncbi:MAG: Beta-lactamase class C-like and penicillin binding proteins (PBPs) superfamily [uncultured Nocardioidaceae bacterium]|uniref:Beta-lactamase class C-like and penicillin binding proteins (PBPs) superfamily n=1 Tax=uncultured Nocardioidaceae bacterium TaxID=253824 RepID=A0A6J4LXV4_9ACTN|nr:MAG: Beta-lactamase class C-like and penicillin binding proteins (PBPs) superfamily [uncultured Nocardioidaceae bacterium]